MTVLRRWRSTVTVTALTIQTHAYRTPCTSILLTVRIPSLMTVDRLTWRSPSRVPSRHLHSFVHASNDAFIISSVQSVTLSVSFIIWFLVLFCFCFVLIFLWCPAKQIKIEKSRILTRRSFKNLSSAFTSHHHITYTHTVQYSTVHHLKSIQLDSSSTPPQFTT